MRSVTDATIRYLLDKCISSGISRTDIRARHADVMSVIRKDLGEACPLNSLSLIAEAVWLLAENDLAKDELEQEVEKTRVALKAAREKLKQYPAAKAPHLRVVK